MEPAKPHAVCIPVPLQGHINPMLKLAKLLNFKGFHITFVHTEFNYNRMISSNGPDSLNGPTDFQFETISDGLPAANQRGIQDLTSLCLTVPVEGKRSFEDLITRLNASTDVPPVSCIVSDGLMSFTLDVAEELGIPEMVLFTHSACGMLGYLNYEELKERGYFPLKDENYLTNGYLDTEIDWIPAMKGIRLKDLPTFLRSTDPDDILFNYNMQHVKKCTKARAVILNTFDDLETEFLDAVKIKYPNLYTIGPLPLLQNKLCFKTQNFIESNLWKQDDNCISWLDKQEHRSVLYVNYGSLMTVTKEQIKEFAWGLANSKYPFLWVIRDDAVNGVEEVFSEEFMVAIKDKGLLVGWCPQEKVLNHSAIGAFLTHCGWNSTLESICEGVPLICWPFFAEQQTNCFYSCRKWGIGVEMDGNVKRGKIVGLVKEVMEGEKGKEMREMCRVWKKKSEEATSSGGSSYINLDLLIKELNV